MALRQLPAIHRLELATLTPPDWHPGAAQSPQCVVYGYAIDHPDGVILFDTGVGIDSDLIDELYQPSCLLLDRALGDCGMELESVTSVVNSHLHFDHCGQNPLLYGTALPFHIGRAEIDAVADDPTYTVAEWALPPDRQRSLVDADTEIAEGVSVLTAPGHTAGHLALLVESRNERVIIGGQVVWDVSEFVEELATPSNVADESLRQPTVESIRRLKALEPDAVYFSHCDHYSPD